VIAFLHEIGVDIELTQDKLDSFLPGVRIETGKLIVNKSALLCPGDILHEAGHLACLLPELRPKANDNITESLGPENSFEMAVILWTFAAAKHLDIPLEQVFHSDGYKGHGEWLIDRLENQEYIGLPLLQWLGLTAADSEVATGKAKPFPEMLRWMRAEN